MLLEHLTKTPSPQQRCSVHDISFRVILTLVSHPCKTFESVGVSLLDEAMLSLFFGLMLTCARVVYVDVEVR